MKKITDFFGSYIRILKKITTFIGTALIYLIAIPIGKIFYFFSPGLNSKKWSNYQPGSSPDTMY